MFEINGKLFDWDDNKNQMNINKHGVSFQEAATVFSDTDAIEADDDEHSQHEDRFIIIGRSRRLRIVVVCHCFRESETVIRIISARMANKEEAKMYGGAE